MTIWKIKPRDILIFRDGRPFTTDAGARSKSLRFPLPSSTAGAVRTRAGTDPATGQFQSSRIDDLLTHSIKGPLLAQQMADRVELMLPAPADCLVLDENKDDKENKKVRRIWLHPLDLPEGQYTDLDETLTIAGAGEIIKDKPSEFAPKYWTWNMLKGWLTAAQDDVCALRDLGHDGPEDEYRTHVAIDPATGTGINGALFQTSGIEFQYLRGIKKQKAPLGELESLALILETDAEVPHGLGSLGQGRRVVQWEEFPQGWPKCLEEISKEIIKTNSCRLEILTPAFFEKGYLPDWLLKEYALEVVSVLLPRYQVVSGWDYEVKRPKATRRLVPAGSVYYLKINGDAESFVNEVWMNNVSDGPQNRLDGFGLAILGTWDGQLSGIKGTEVN